MLGQVLRVKGYYDVMIHKHHSEDVYDLIDLSVGRGTFKGFSIKMSYLRESGTDEKITVKTL